MSAQLADDSSDGDDANLVGLRAIGEDAPLVDPNADTFELDLGAGRKVIIPMDRSAQRRGVAGVAEAQQRGTTVPLRCEYSSALIGARVPLLWHASQPRPCALPSARRGKASFVRPQFPHQCARSYGAYKI